MELVSLDIERFGRIVQRSLAFRPGLNVLFGPNEAGKSSIARAIRFALLLPSSSNAAEPWIPWNDTGSGSADGDPTITLVFKTSDTTFHRVRKVFGTATASLERSSDGSGWAHVAKGRDVEGKIRALLAWGIPEPGGAKAPKGLPESFLAEALLAEQDGVMRVFTQDLAKDGVDSGRTQIRAALEAIAQDPLFKSCLDAAQARVDQAFTATGRAKSGANAPLARVAEEVRERQQERDEAEQAADASRALAARASELSLELSRAAGALHEATERRTALERRRLRQAAIVAASAARQAGQTLIDAVTEAQRKIDAAASAVQTVEPQLPALQKADADARKTFEAATARASAAREKRKGELAQEDTAIVHAREALRVRRERAALAADVRKADGLEREAGQISRELARLGGEVATLAAVEPWLARRAAAKDVADAEQRAVQETKLIAEARDARARATQTWPGAHSALLPDTARLDELAKLHGRLAIAAAKLDVGLSLDVRGAATAAISIDGGAADVTKLPASVEARRAAQIALPGGVQIVVRGGRAGDRAAADALREAWTAATADLFARLGVADLDALIALARADAAGKTAAAALAQSAETLELRVAQLGDPAADQAVHRARLAELDRALDGVDVIAVEAAAGGSWRALHTRQVAAQAAARDALTTLRAQAAALRERCAGVDTTLDVDSETAIAADTAALDLRDRALAEESQALEAPRGKRDDLQDKVDTAKRALDAALAQVAAARTERDVWTARLDERRPAAAGLDLDALAANEAAARAAAGADGAPVDEAAVARAQQDEESAHAQHERVVGELHTAEGALLASGGAAADERLAELEVALERAHEKQGQIEDDFEAWKLLAEALKDAEKSQSTHLGSVLAPDLAARFQSLAGARYDGVTLGPHLGLEGIHSTGGARDLERLSIGTQEQLSTLFRLVLAEKLGSALLLDDQLVQSDPDRLRWFRRALRQTAALGVQIIVLTCRPDDYLEPAEQPGPHTIDLSV